MPQFGRVRSRALTCAPVPPLQTFPVRIAIVALLLSGLAPVTVAKAATYTFTAVADGYTRSDAAATNYGSTTRISDRGMSSQQRNSYLRFNVAVLAGETITSATLKVYSATSGSNVDLRDVTSDTWTEPGLTWNSAPTFSSPTTRVRSFSKSRSVSFNASSLVKYAGLASMALTTTSSSAINFYSREAGSNRPQLVVQTALAVPDPAPEPAPAPAPTPAPAPVSDTTAPDTSIGSSPASTTTASTASFSFTGSDETSAAGALSFQCSLDGGGFAACSSIKTYGGLALGVHSFAVRAIDEAGNVDASPAQSSWTVIAVSDTTPPTAPGSLSATAGNAQVSLSWSASTDNVAVTGYRVYQGSTLVSSPTGRSATVTGLTNGTSYSFTVKAIDAAGNLSAASNTASATPVAPVAAACADGLDNDADGKIDYPADPGCASASDTDETDVATARRYFGTEPVGTAGIPRSNSYCADHILRSSWEPRPSNTQYNAPRQDQASPYDSWWSSFPAWLTLRAQVDGGFVNSDGSRPTTTEIFSFAACKWGIDEDLIRAAAVQETGWDQRAIGDVCGANPTGTGQGSFSILQIKNRNCSNEGDWGGYPRTYDSTTYAADFYGAAFRGCMNDDFWYPTVTDQTTLVWGCVGAWFSGGWDPNQSYVVSVKKWLANRTWTSY